MQKRGRDKASVVNDLVNMRTFIRATSAEQASWVLAFQESGLSKCLLRVCEPGNLLETSHPDVEQSWRFHDWAYSYGEILARLTTPEMIAQAAKKIQNISVSRRKLSWNLN